VAAEPWRWGALALVVGGLLGAFGGVLFLAVDDVGAWLTVIALLLVGIGLLGLAAGFRSTRLREWARWLLTAAGVLLLLEFLSNAVSNLGFGGLDFYGLALPPITALVLLAAAGMILVDRAAPGPARWVLLLPGGWSLLLALVALTGPLASWWAVAVADLLFAVAGGVYLAAVRSHGRASIAHA
jgi:hypothetical protein